MFIDFSLIFGPRWDQFEARFSKKQGLKFDVKLNDFLDGSDESDVGGLRPRQGTLLTT